MTVWRSGPHLFSLHRIERDKVPDAFGLGGMLGIVRIDHWKCPSGMVITGMAIGHNLDKKGNDTRQVYILAECRKLL